MFEFQTAMSELTGLPVSNAGLYEGPSSVASAGYLAIGARPGAGASSSPAASTRTAARRCATYSAGYGAEVVEVGLEGGLTDAAALAEAVDGETAAVFLQSPNFLGAVEDVEALGAAAKEHGALLVVACDPMTLGILRPPGECGADIALGEGQPLGNRLDFGGPSFGFFCATEEQIRRMPGRIAGETERRRRPPRLRPRAADPRAAHPPREGDQQHLHRAGAERARRRWSTSPGSAARASASSASCWSGAPPTRASGWPRSRASSCCTRRRSCASSRCGSTRRSTRVLERCAERGIAAGYPLGREYPEHEDGLLVAITERRTRAADRRARRGARGRDRGASVAVGRRSERKRLQRGEERA